MAIPKVCGIENEFGFSVFNEEGKQLNDLDYEIYLINFKHKLTYNL